MKKKAIFFCLMYGFINLMANDKIYCYGTIYKIEGNISDTLKWFELSLDSSNLLNSNIDTLFPPIDKIVDFGKIEIKDCRLINDSVFGKCLSKINFELKRRRIIKLQFYWDNCNEFFLPTILNSFNKSYLKELYISCKIIKPIKIDSLNYPEITSLNFQTITMQLGSVYYGKSFLKNLPNLITLSINGFESGPNLFIKNSFKELFDVQLVKSNVKNLIIEVPNFYLIQRLIDDCPSIETIEINHLDNFSLTKCKSLTETRINNSFSVKQSPISLRKLCKILPIQIKKLYLPLLLKDTKLKKCLLKFKDLEELSIPYIYNLKNPEILLKYKHLKKITFHSLGNIKWVRKIKVHSFRQLLLIKGSDIKLRKEIDQCFINNCNKYYYFYFEHSEITPYINMKLIKKYLRVIGQMNIEYLYIDAEYLFLSDDEILENLKDIPEIVVKDPMLSRLIRPDHYFFSKQEIIWKKLSLPTEYKIFKLN